MDKSRIDFSVTKLRAAFAGPHCFVPTSDGKTLFMRVWEPPTGTFRNVAILFLHGITAHSGAYNNILATPLAKGGFTVYGLDLRGHGLSDGVRGDIPSKDRLIHDVCESIALIKAKHQKLLLLGHSIGVIAVIYAISHCSAGISGAIFLSMGQRFQTGVHRPTTLRTKLKIGVCALFRPGHPIVKYSHPGIAGIGDPMYTFIYTHRFMRIMNPRKVRFPPQIAIPIYVGAGENDELFAVEQVRKFYEEVPADQKEFHVIPGAKHAAFPEGCLDHMMTWIQTVLTHS